MNNNFETFDLNEEYTADDVQDIPDLNETFVGETHSCVGDESVNDLLAPPDLGMMFPTGEELVAYISTYAHKCGFEIIHRTTEVLDHYRELGYSKKNVDPKMHPQFHMMKRIRFMCKKGGRSTKNKQNECNCQFVVEGRVLEGSTSMRITFVRLEHTHPLKPDETRHMVSYRRINPYHKKRMLQNAAAGISLVKSYNSFVLESGGHENMSFNRRDMRNALNAQKRGDRIMGDAASLEEYFKKMVAENPDFFYSILRDKDGKLVNVFWADARCRALFKAFCDVITFDTTFLCNRGESPWKVHTFAAALISREDTESFVWVFERWMECMGKAPRVILTDQCRAIGRAVKNVFGEDFPHRLCLWHIMRNGMKNLGSCSNWSKIESELKMAVHDSLEVDEFESAWDGMVAEYGIENNGWIKESWEIRRQWVPAYWRGTFCAGMSSTQRSEQQNRFFKAYVSLECGLRTFVEQFENALKLKAEEEKVDDFVCEDRPCKLSGEGVRVEEVFQKVYTNSIVREFQGEVRAFKNVNLTVIDKVGTKTNYMADERIKDPPWRKGRKTFELSLDSGEGEYICSCKLFEFKGLICRHIIKGLEFEEINTVPERYVLDRWKKSILRGHEHIRVGYYDPVESTRAKRSMDVVFQNDVISNLALTDSNTLEMYNIASGALLKQLEEYVGIETVNNSGTGSNSLKVWGRRKLQRVENGYRHKAKTTPAPAVDGIRDPPSKRGKGRAPKPKQKTYPKKRKVTDSPATPSRSTCFANHDIGYASSQSTSFKKSCRGVLSGLRL